VFSLNRNGVFSDLGTNHPKHSYVQEPQEAYTRLTLAEAKSLAKRMGLSDKTVSKLKLRPDMQQDAVFTLVGQHLRLAERKSRKA
jgi:hypothetical protein